MASKKTTTQTKELTVAELLRKWHTHGALWLMENPNWIMQNTYLILRAVPKATAEHTEFLVDMSHSIVWTIHEAIAKNPHTPAEVLQKFALSPNSSVRVYVASNPQTPVFILHRLCVDPFISVRNTARKNPNLHNQIDAAWTELCNTVQSSPNLPATLAEHPDFIWLFSLLLQNPHTPTVLLQKMIDILSKRTELSRWDQSTKNILSQHANTPPAFLDILTETVNAYEYYGGSWTSATATLQLSPIQTAAILHPKTPIATLVRLAESSNVLMRYTVAQNPRLPLEQLCMLAEDSSTEVIKKVISNPATPFALVAKLAQTQHELVLASLTSRPDVLQQVLLTLVTHPNPSVQIALAQNVYTPIDVLQTYVTHEDIFVRKSVAQNPALSVAMVEQLAKDTEPSVRLQIINHAKLPRTLLQKLTLDEEQSVSQQATRIYYA